MFRSVKRTINTSASLVRNQKWQDGIKFTALLEDIERVRQKKEFLEEIDYLSNKPSIMVLGDNQASNVLCSVLRSNINAKVTQFDTIRPPRYLPTKYKRELFVLFHDCFYYPSENYWYQWLVDNNINNAIGVLTTRPGANPKLKSIVSAILHNEELSLLYGWNKLQHDNNGINRTELKNVTQTIKVIHDAFN